MACGVLVRGVEEGICRLTAIGTILGSDEDVMISCRSHLLVFLVRERSSDAPSDGSTDYDNGDNGE